MDGQSAVPWLQRERPALIGMIHLAPLPGTPQSTLPFGDIRRQAMTEAEALVASDFDALIVENMGDTPIFRGKLVRYCDDRGHCRYRFFRCAGGVQA